MAPEMRRMFSLLTVNIEWFAAKNGVHTHGKKE